MNKTSSVHRSFSVIAVVIIFITLSAVPAHAALTKIVEGVYSYVDEKSPSPANSFGANAGIVVGKDGIVVIDTLISAKEAQRFIKDIRLVSDKPIRYVIDTHDHLDHVLGNCEFAKQGATIVAQSETKAAIVKNGDGLLGRAKYFGLTDEAMAGTTVVMPSLTFSDSMEIDLGDRKVRVMLAGPSHTGGSSIVYIPESKVLFAGDVLFTNYHPNMRDGDIQGWVRSLDRIAAMDVASIVPGHGPLSTKKDIDDMKVYLLAFDAKAKELAAKSDSADAIAAEIKKAIPSRTYFDMFIASNVKGLYLKK
ncbi:MAG: MBL fold metallo-hydrolase [Nitrospiraceae bacterium]|nr:MBL fold metallo-hydrolase [Nitrospiraceae bacterium]